MVVFLLFVPHLSAFNSNHPASTLLIRTNIFLHGMRILNLNLNPNPNLLLSPLLASTATYTYLHLKIGLSALEFFSAFCFPSQRELKRRWPNADHQIGELR